MTQLLWTDVENVKDLPNVNSVLFLKCVSFVVSWIFNAVVKELMDAGSLTFHVTLLRQCWSTKRFFLSDINELSLPKTCQVDFPDPDDLLSFKLIISPDEVIQIFSMAPHWCYLRTTILEYYYYALFHLSIFVGVLQRRSICIQLQSWTRISPWTSKGEVWHNGVSSKHWPGRKHLP